MGNKYKEQFLVHTLSYTFPFDDVMTVYKPPSDDDGASETLKKSWSNPQRQ
jgi:hypothetical protein